MLLELGNGTYLFLMENIATLSFNPAKLSHFLISAKAFLRFSGFVSWIAKKVSECLRRSTSGDQKVEHFDHAASPQDVSRAEI